MKKYFVTAVIGAAAALAFAGETSDNPVLMTVDGNDIRVSEFNYLYNKNNSQQVAPQTLDQYLGMFIDYKLKVADALHAGLDRTDAFKSEFSSFRSELSRPYMRDTTVQNRLIEEAYQRRRSEVEVSHIMLPLEDGQDAKLDSIRRAILAGNTTFEQAAEQYSVDRGSKQHGGRMGYVIPDRYPYAFELAAYSTPVGQISEVVNSGVGYHLIRVESTRPARGEVLAEHILLLTRNLDSLEIANVRQRIDSLHTLAVNGADFAELARTYSQDPGTARSGGRLPWFGSGAMVAPFDSAAFAIANGTISEPFLTNYGYHIIHKIDSRAVPPLENIRGEIIQRMTNDERGNMPEQAVTERIKSQYHVAMVPDARQKLARKIAKNAGGYDAAMIEKLKNDHTVLATADNGIKIRVCDIIKDVPGTSSTDADNAAGLITGRAYAAATTAALDMYRDNLADINPDYRNLLNEYRDGMLLYEISNRNVWNRASTDKEGLENYFRTHIDNYAWNEPKFKSFVIFASSDSVLNEAINYADSLSTDDPARFASDMRARFGRDVKVERVIAAKGENAITDYLAFDGDKPSADAKSHWKAYRAYKGRVINQPEEAADVRGAAVTDFQGELDHQWVEQLHKRYKVKVNQQVFEQLKAAQQK